MPGKQNVRDNAVAAPADPDQSKNNSSCSNEGGERKLIMSRNWVERREVEGSIIHTAQERRVISNAKLGVISSYMELKNEVLSTERFFF